MVDTTAAPAKRESRITTPRSRSGDRPAERLTLEVAVVTPPDRPAPVPLVDETPLDAGRASPFGEHSEAAIPGAAVLVGAPRIPAAVAVAVEFGKAGNGWAGALVFNVWLRRQLRERRLSQRQLAARSGVNHSTISRILSDGRAPTLETATKLAHALRLEWSDDEVAAYFDLLDQRPLMPAQRVEQALRGDDDLSEEDVRALMRQYLAARSRRGNGHAEGRQGGAPPSVPQYREGSAGGERVQAQVAESRHPKPRRLERRAVTTETRS